MVLGSGPPRERKKERKRELERAYLNSHRTPDRTGEVLQITDDPSPRHKLLQHKYSRLRQEGSGDTVAPSDDTPRQGQTGRI